MEERPARPDPRGLKPPFVPPTAIALGGSGESDAVYLRAFRTHLQMLRLASVSPLTPEASLEGEQALSELDSLLRGAGSEFLREAIAELHRQRADLQEQVELERIVTRPPRKGYELIRPEDDHPTAIDREIRLIDTILKTLER